MKNKSVADGFPVSTVTTSPRPRLAELDFLKGVLILLMVAFHLVYVSQQHPYAKQIVYTFHMPAFLVISGFLMHFDRPWRHFLTTILWFAVPYIVMESGYIVMASILPINEHIDRLTLPVFLRHLLLRPLGPYWYLQVLIVSGTVHYSVCRLARHPAVRALCARLTEGSPAVAPLFLLSGLLCFLCHAVAGAPAFSSSLYFLLGALLRQCGVRFTRFFQPTLLAPVPLALLACHPSCLHQPSLGGAAVVWLAVSSLLALFPHVGGVLRRALLFTGRHTLPVFLFSPVFTILCKPLVPLFAFDPTALLFTLVSVALCVAGSLLIAKLLDVCRLTPWLFGRRHLLSLRQ